MVIEMLRCGFGAFLGGHLACVAISPVNTLSVIVDHTCQWDKYLWPDGSWSVNINLENTVAETVLPGQPLLRRWVSGMRQVILHFRMQIHRWSDSVCKKKARRNLLYGSAILRRP